MTSPYDGSRARAPVSGDDAVAARAVRPARDAWAPARVAEVHDALERRQREVPAWVLAELADDGQPGALGVAPGFVRAQDELLAAALPRLLALSTPRAVVQIGAARGLDLLVDALLDRGAVDRLVIVDPAERAARRAARALAARRPDAAIAAVVADPTMTLALPRGLPHPRLHLCGCRAIGGAGTVGAVRLLRVVRATMSPHDRLVAELDVRHDRAVLEDEGYDADGTTAALHLRVLDALNRELGADFDRSRFAYRVEYDDEVRRVDTHLVAQRTTTVTFPHRPGFTLRKGESIRTSAECKHERSRMAAMLAGVGLRVEGWLDDPAGRCAILVAAPGT